MKITINAQCIQCGAIKKIEVDEENYISWLKNEGNIQDLLPELSADERELLISSICGSCFDNIFAKDDCDEEYNSDFEPGEDDYIY